MVRLEPAGVSRLPVACVLERQARRRTSRSSRHGDPMRAARQPARPSTTGHRRPLRTRRTTEVAVVVHEEAFVGVRVGDHLSEVEAQVVYRFGNEHLLPFLRGDHDRHHGRAVIALVHVVEVQLEPVGAEPVTVPSHRKVSSSIWCCPSLRAALPERCPPGWAAHHLAVAHDGGRLT